MLKRLVLLGFVLLSGGAAASEPGAHAGYYYPPVTSEEQFERILRPMPPAPREVRVDFVTMLTAAQLAAPESPRFVFFAKGAEANKLILVALDDEVFKTLFRARAVLAQMTSNLRNGAFFRQQNVQYGATFFDMLQMMEFDTLVVSDGESWAHEVSFVRN